MSDSYTKEEKLAIIRNRKQKKRKRTFVLFCFILCCTGILLLVFKAPFFDITAIKCEGMSILSQKKIMEKAEVKVGENIFSTSTSKIEERIATLAYVDEVKVSRTFPSEIKITVKECVPRAYIAFENKFVLIDYNGKILEMPKKNDKYNVMTIKGIKLKNPQVGSLIANDEDNRIKYCKSALEIMETNKMNEKVKEIDFSKLTNIKINYDNRAFISCGSYENYDSFKYKLQVCNHLLQEEIVESEKVEIDLTMEETIVRPYVSEEEKKLKEKLEKEKEKEQETENNTSEEKVDKGEKTEEEENDEA